jgi:hypothetical protein
MGLFDCKSKDAEISSLKKELFELRGDLSWYINKYGVKNTATVKKSSKGGTRKRTTKHRKHRSRRNRF